MNLYIYILYIYIQKYYIGMGVCSISRISHELEDRLRSNFQRVTFRYILPLMVSFH